MIILEHFPRSMKTHSSGSISLDYLMIWLVHIEKDIVANHYL